MGGGGGQFVEVAAVTPVEAERPAAPRNAARPERQMAGARTARRDPDLSVVAAANPVTTPAAAAVRANQPALVTRLPEMEADAEKLNYLEIQWFDFSGRHRDKVIQEVRAVQQFLAADGVETVARRVTGGIRLYSRRGYSMSDADRSARQAFQEKVAELGRAYRRQGGLYEWTDCFFVSYGRATSGEAI